MTRRFQILVCRGPECGDRHDSAALARAFEGELVRLDLGATVKLAWQSCFGRCTQGPNVLIGELQPATTAPRFAFAALGDKRTSRSALYNGVVPGDAAELIEQHILNGTLVRRLIRPITAGSRPATSASEPPPLTRPNDRRSDGDG